MVLDVGKYQVEFGSLVLYFYFVVCTCRVNIKIYDIID